jgi:hypothetical protein
MQHGRSSVGRKRVPDGVRIDRSVYIVTPLLTMVRSLTFVLSVI